MQSQRSGAPDLGRGSSSDLSLHARHVLVEHLAVAVQAAADEGTDGSPVQGRSLPLPREVREEADDGFLEAVPFVPFRCPACGRHKPFTYKVRGRVRYHRCQACGGRYKSFEVPSDFVRDWRPPDEGS